MTFDSFYALEQLRALERYVAETPARVESLRLAYAREDRAEILCSLMDGERLLSAMAITAARLKELIVTTDGLGNSLESLSELVLRTVRMVVLTELAALRDVISDVAACGRGHALFRGRFRSVDDLLAYVHEELDQITQIWSSYRDRRCTDRTAFRDALYAAARAMQNLGRAPELARFLREGSLRDDWPPLASTCWRIRAALDIQLAVQPDRPLLLHTHRLHELITAGQR